MAYLINYFYHLKTRCGRQKRITDSKKKISFLDGSLLYKTHWFISYLNISNQHTSCVIKRHVSYPQKPKKYHKIVRQPVFSLRVMKNTHVMIYTHKHTHLQRTILMTLLLIQMKSWKHAKTFYSLRRSVHLN